MEWRATNVRYSCLYACFNNKDSTKNQNKINTKATAFSCSITMYISTCLFIGFTSINSWCCLHARVSVYLVNRIENLDPELPELVIPIVGRSLLPYCHFDIPESDYLSGDRRDAKLPGPIGYQPDDNSLPEGTRAIELDVIGIGGSHVK